ncbi:SigB/SigF/SigG family RNA polymerase sigma factor [Streptomyces sp. Q6]|uniref:SigB/SigF/SigG family RNA polymerase sigma factor n=1 Tax=Streptomyces citrinus TaxID=3118173 RepID=A0ACD5AMD8_9ACTN
MMTQTAAHPAPRTTAPGRHPHDDAPDTAVLFARLNSLDAGPEYDLVCEQLASAWLPMAHRIAGRYRDRGESLDDLKQVAAVGLLKAIKRFDPERGAFESYAVPTITGELRRHFRDRTWDLRVPRRVQDLRNKVRAARRDIADAPGAGEPGIAEIAEHTGLTEQEVRDGLEALESYTALSLDAELATSDDGYSLADVLGTADPGFDLVTDREAARQGLRELPERERAILYMRFFEDMTQSRIAEQLGISQMHVSRLINRSCDRVRRSATGEAA